MCGYICMCAIILGGRYTAEYKFGRGDFGMGECPRAEYSKRIVASVMSVNRGNKREGRRNGNAYSLFHDFLTQLDCRVSPLRDLSASGAR